MLKFIKNKAFEKTHKIKIDEEILDPKNVKQFFNEAKYHQTIKVFGNLQTKKLQGELDKLVRDIQELETRIQKKHEEKDQLINQIITLSHEINSTENKSLTKGLETEKIEIDKVKKEIEELNIALENKHLQLKETQKKLFKMMAEISYTRFLHEQQKLSKVQKNIAGLRKKLDGLREEKEGIEGKLNELYQMLHSVMGHEQMEQMDLTFLTEFREEENKEKNYD